MHKMKRQVLVPAILAGILVIIVAAGFAYGYSSSASINSNLKVSDVKLGSIAPLPNTEGMVMYVNALLKNDGGSVALLRNVEYNVLVDGKNVGTYTENTVAIPPGGVRNVTIKVMISGDAMNAIVNDIQKGSMNLGVKASWSLPAGWYGAAQFTTIQGSSMASKNVKVGSLLGGSESQQPLQAQVFPVSIYKAGWEVNGQDVDEVKDGTTVKAYVVFTINQDLGDNGYNIRICVMHDIRAGIDTHIMCSTITLQGKKGSQVTVYVPFKAEHHWYARGYYIIVGTPRLDSSTKLSQKLYEMENHYPPRLKVNK